ncbi:MAG: succinylglutamate-semialdehyde dehydrogenase [Legionellaceae bacterium]|nr:succinylglutamate-semialdehyde dehydrogenase [Legionellaceae bacterium]
MATIHAPIGKQYIDGHWIQGSGRAFHSINPANHTTIWNGTNATPPEVAAAFEAALHAQKKWAHLPLETRITHLKQFATCIETYGEQLTDCIALETGKPLWEAKTETHAVIQKIQLSIDAYNARTSPITTKTDEAAQCLRYKPHGVVAVLGAFNFPAHLSNGHIVPALLAGNAIVYKPSEHAPYVAELMMRCWHDSGLPKGVLNLIQGGAETAHALLELPVKVVCFTGSYPTGLSIHHQFSARPEVLLALEMGGNNPLIIDETLKNVPAAVYHTLLSSFLTTGQRCTSARRVIIPDNPTGDNFLKQLLSATQALVIGAPNDTPEPFMGPLIHPKQAKNVLNAEAQLISLGATPLLKMHLFEENSAFITPGILDMRAVCNPIDEEIFGPLVQVHRYQHFEEAIERANQTRYGLAAGLLGDNRTHYEMFYQNIQAGLVNWNRPTTGAASSLPFGGIGCSGNHHPSAYFAADYVAYPTASLESEALCLPKAQLPGIQLETPRGL